MRTILSALIVVVFTFSVSAGTISLVADTNQPDPNEEVTVWVHTDTPLFALGLGVYVLGDANITSAMCEADCNQYGWDNGWNSDPYIDPNGWVYLGGVKWAGDANGTVGYFKFRYNHWQTRVYIDQENSCSIGWDSNSSSYVNIPFSTEVLSFGEPDPNEPNEPNEPNVNPPPNHWVQTFLGREPNSANFPDSNSTTIPDRSQWQGDSLFGQDKDDGGEMQLDSEPNVIEITSDITTNQIWAANNIYHVTETVNIQALLVIEPGAEISFGNNGGLVVNNGGTLISAGTPDNPIVYTSDSSSGWMDYYCAIEVQESASPATKIVYSSIDCAFIAIITSNIRLDTPIQQNHLFYNNIGILEYGTKHTNIINNLIFGGFNEYYYSDAIRIFMESKTETADANSFILIENNTCDYQDFGITVHGTEDGNDMGTPWLINNIVSESAECGMNLVDGWINYIVTNIGYYGNSQDRNWEFQEYDPVMTTAYPFDENGWHLVNDCSFINAGLERIEQTSLIGETTDLNSTPDSNTIDIGYHYSNWDFSNAGTGNILNTDYDGSLKVDFKDFAILANGWLIAYDINDLSTMANEWLSMTNGHPAIAMSIVGDGNNLGGEVEVGVTGCASYSTSTAYIFMDGLLLDEVDYEDSSMLGIIINTPSYLNGEHSLKGVIVDHNGLITISEDLLVDFNNPLHCLSVNGTYEPNTPLRLLGLNATENNLQVKLSQWDGTSIWSQTTSGNLDVNIPGNVLMGQIYDLNIEQEIGGEMLLLDSSWETIWEKAITAEYDMTKNYQYAIIIPTAWSYLQDSAKSRKRAVAAIVSSCETMGIPYIILYKDNCTWENFAQVLSKPTVCYAYVVSRGADTISYYTDQRTYFQLSGGHKVVSYVNPAEPIGEGWDNNPKVHSMASLGFGDTNKFKIIWIDVCLNGKYGDMAAAWMKFDFPTFDKLYISWNAPIQTSNDSDFCSWTTFFWGDPDGFGLYGANTYYQAFNRAMIEVHSGTWIGQRVATFGDTNIRFIHIH